MPAAAVASRTPAIGGISGNAGARGEMFVDMFLRVIPGRAEGASPESVTPTFQVRTGYCRGYGFRLSLLSAGMTNKVFGTPRNGIRHFFDGAAGLSEVFGSIGLSRRSTLAALRNFSTSCDCARCAT